MGLGFDWRKQELIGLLGQKRLQNGLSFGTDRNDPRVLPPVVLMSCGFLKPDIAPSIDVDTAHDHYLARSHSSQTLKLNQCCN